MASDDVNRDFLGQQNKPRPDLQLNKPRPDLVQIPIREKEKAIYCNMRAAFGVRARLWEYIDSAMVMPRLKIFLRTRQGEYSINF